MEVYSAAVSLLNLFFIFSNKYFFDITPLQLWEILEKIKREYKWVTLFLDDVNFRKMINIEPQRLTFDEVIKFLEESKFFYSELQTFSSIFQENSNLMSYRGDYV